MMDILDPIVLQIDKTVLVNNWRWLAQQSAGASCSVVVKANAYGLGHKMPNGDTLISVHMMAPDLQAL